MSRLRYLYGSFLYRGPGLEIEKLWYICYFSSEDAKSTQTKKKHEFSMLKGKWIPIMIYVASITWPSFNIHCYCFFWFDNCSYIYQHPDSSFKLSQQCLLLGVSMGTVRVGWRHFYICTRNDNERKSLSLSVFSNTVWVR